MLELWIARDKDDSLNLFKSKPVRDNYGYFRSSIVVNQCNTDMSDRLLTIWDSDLFPEVTWENSPQLVELKLK